MSRIGKILAAFVLAACVILSVSSRMTTVQAGSRNTLSVNVASGMIGTCPWTYENGTVTIGPENGECVLNTNWTHLSNSPIRAIDFKGTVNSGNNHISGLFNSMSELETVTNIQNLKVQAGASVIGLFSSCSSLKALDASNWDTSNITDMTGMFDGCRALKTLNASGWDTSNVVSMKNMFLHTDSMTSVKGLERWSTPSLETMQEMFSSSAIQTLDLQNFDTDSLTTINGVFSYCGMKSLVLPEGFSRVSADEMSTSGLQTCSNLKSITFPSDFDFKDMSLPTPQNYGLYNGKWTYGSSFNTADAMTPSELRENWNPDTMAGTWVWARNGSSELMNHYVSDGSSWEDYSNENGTWHKVSDYVWQFIFNVFSTEDELPYYVWEDEVPGYESNATASAPIVTTTGEAVIKNESRTYEPDPVGYLKILKTVSDNSTSTFLFRIRITDKNNEPLTGTNVFSDVAFINGIGSVRLSKDQYKTLEIPAGYHYFITEDETAGYTSSGTATEGIIPENSIVTAAFNNAANNNPAGALVLQKKAEGNGVDAAAQYEFFVSFTGLTGLKTYSMSNGDTYTTDANGNATVTLTLPKDGSVTFTSLPVGSKYMILEQPGAYVASYELTGANAEFVKSRDANVTENKVLSTSLESIPEGTVTCTYTNSFNKKSNLVLQKIVDDSASEQDEARFEFTVLLSGLEPGASYNSDYGRMIADDNGEAEKTFYLSNGEKAVFEDLPYNSTYSITESASSYKASYSVNGGTPVSNTVTNRELSTGERTIEDIAENTVVFTNRVTRSSLTVRKQVESDLPSDLEKEFTFTVTMKNGHDNTESIAAPLTGTFVCTKSRPGSASSTGEIVFSRTGVGTFTLKHNETIQITGLPVGSTYSIAEVSDGFVSEVTEGSEKGSVLTDNASSVTFTNTGVHKTAVTLEKRVRGNLGSRDKDFEFTVVLANDSGDTDGTYYYSGTQQGVSVSDKPLTISAGTGTIMLRHGDSIRFEVNIGTRVTLTERDYSPEGYSVEYSGYDSGKQYLTADADEARNKIIATNTNGTAIPTGVGPFSSGVGLLTAGAAGFYIYFKPDVRSRIERMILL